MRLNSRMSSFFRSGLFYLVLVNLCFSWTASGIYDVQGCLPEVTSLIVRAQDEILDMLRYTQERLERLIDWWDQEDPKAVRAMAALPSPDFASTVRTYESIYSAHLHIQAKRTKPLLQRQDQLKQMRWLLGLTKTLIVNFEYVRNMPSQPGYIELWEGPTEETHKMFRSMHERAPNQKFVQYWCGDRWLKDKDANGNPLSIPGEYFDGRPDVFVESYDQRRWVFLRSGRFGPRLDPDGSTSYGVALNRYDGMAPPFSTVITLNPWRVSEWQSPRVDTYNDLKQISSVQTGSSGLKLTEIMESQLSSAILGLFLSNNDFTQDSNLVVTTCKDRVTAQDLSPWSWKCLKQLSEDLDFQVPMHSGVSYKFFVAAMYMNNSDWSKNTARALGLARSA